MRPYRPCWSKPRCSRQNGPSRKRFAFKAQKQPLRSVHSVRLEAECLWSRQTETEFDEVLYSAFTLSNRRIDFAGSWMPRLLFVQAIRQGVVFTLYCATEGMNEGQSILFTEFHVTFYKI
jgi:hypothetical protein